MGACAVLDILKLLLRGVWTGRRTCWPGCGRKSGIVCDCFLKTNTRRTRIFKPSIWQIKHFGWETVENHWQRSGRSGRTAGKHCNDSVFQLIEIWKKQKFFFPTTSTFELSDSFVVFCKGLAQIWERAWISLPTNCAFLIDIAFTFWLPFVWMHQHFKPLSSVASHGD